MIHAPSSTQTKTDNVVRSLKRPASPSNWWHYPASVATVLLAFTGYSIWTALQGSNSFHQFLSPYYSPQIAVGRTPVSPAFFVLWVPLLFRATCYYYRKAYFRGFFAHPPACAHTEPKRRSYLGETQFPFILNNLHRFFFYLAVIVLAFLWWDALRAFDYNGHFYLGVASVLMLVNVVLLSLYTFGCHAFRHLAGGRLNCYSCSRSAKFMLNTWKGVTTLNIRHSRFAWLSLFSVAIVDAYIHLLAAHVFVDPHILF